MIIIIIIIIVMIIIIQNQFSMESTYEKTSDSKNDA